MTITTLDGLLSAIASNRNRLQISKAQITGQVSGAQTSFWRSAGIPAAGAIPTVAAVCTNALLGAFPYTNPTGGASAYLSRLAIAATIVGGVEVHDRLMHMGGLNGTLTTAQTVGVDLNANSGTSNLLQRLGASDYSSVQWFIEDYTTLGVTGVNATVSYTDQNGTAGKTVVVALPASTANGRYIQIVPNAGDNIRSIETITLSATTGTAGNFGVTASVERTSINCGVVNQLFISDWAQLGLPQIYDNSCLFLVADTTATNPGSFGGSLLIAKG
jgi:hypothetical protein